MDTPSEIPPPIPLSVPVIRGNEWTYVKDCLDTGWVSSVGGYVDRFERELARVVGARHAVATVNGTAALHVALLVAGVEKDDEVVVPALTFIAPSNAVRYCGAFPVFVDVDPANWQLDPRRFEEFLVGQCVRQDGVTRNRATGRRVRAVVPVDLLGHPCDIDAIQRLAHEFGLVVVEDATESLGAAYRGTPVGSRADLACFSFNGNKIVTTGGGGMVVTQNEQYARRVRYLTTQAKDDPLEYVHGAVGFNYRLTNVLAAIGLAQLEVLESHVQTKREIAERYAKGIEDVRGLAPMPQSPWAEGTAWLYTVLVRAQDYGMSSRALISLLSERRIEARPLWQPLHRSPANADLPPRDCPVADALARDAVSLPSSVNLTPAEQQRVLEAIRR